MKKIAVITTGGTIGSILSSESVSVDLSARRISREIDVAKNKLGYEVIVDSPINKNSEDFSPEDWGTILSSIVKANNSDVDGIVVTHGTDTLAYSVAAALAFNNLWEKKICFTGAYYSPDHPTSDTSLSLLAALEFAVSPHPSNGVYVAFRSNEHNSEAHILNGASIKPMDFDDMFFEAAYGHSVSTYSPKHGISEEISLSTMQIPCLGTKAIPNSAQITAARKKVAFLTLYPGIDSALLSAAAQGRDILVIQMYHSGTGPTGISSELLQFIESLPSTVTVLMGTFPKETIDLPYESTVELKKKGAKVYFDLQAHFLLTFAMLGLASGLSAGEISKKLINFEI